MTKYYQLNTANKLN